MDVYSRIIFSLIHTTGQEGIHEYYKKKSDLKQMSGSPVVCKKKKKKNNEYLQKPKKQISASTNTRPIHKQFNSILGCSLAKQSKTDTYFSYIWCSSTVCLRVH